VPRPHQWPQLLALFVTVSRRASVIRNRLAAGGYGKTPTEIVHAPNRGQKNMEGKAIFMALEAMA
jgi:hypothetical protein